LVASPVVPPSSVRISAVVADVDARLGHGAVVAGDTQVLAVDGV
jgi:hypothetical protein